MNKCILNDKILNHLSNFSIITAVLICIFSLYPWFIWYIPANVYFPILFILLRLPILITNRKLKLKILIAQFPLAIFSALYCKFLIIEPRHNTINLLLSLVPLSILILFSDKELKIFMDYLIKIFSILLLISLVGFTLKTIGLELPYSILENPNPWYNPYKNYYIFTVYNDFGPFTRFTSMMQEPGHIGMSCAILLYITGYSIKKWYNIVMTISLIWSFSLAGYVLYVLGLIIYSVFSQKSSMIPILKIGIFISLIIPTILTYYYSNKDSVISTLVLSRLEMDRNGELSGNNRNTTDFEIFYDNFLKSDELLLGMKHEIFAKKWGGTPNSSYKNFIMEKGILSALFLLVFCTIYTYQYQTKLGFGLLLLLIISFLQRPYFLWPVQSYAFVAAIRILYNDIKLQHKITKQLNYENNFHYIS